MRWPQSRRWFTIGAGLGLLVALTASVLPAGLALRSRPTRNGSAYRIE